MWVALKYFLFFLSWMGMGAWFFSPSISKKGFSAQYAVLSLIFGVSLSHLYLVLGVPLRVLVGITYLVGISFWGFYFFKNSIRFPHLPIRWLIAILLSTLILTKAVFEPICTWDARSIWYFHGKILYYENGLKPQSFQKPELQFSHPDYPKLTSLLAAESAVVSGLWNDYRPKLNILPLYFASQVAVFALPYSTPVVTLISVFAWAIGGFHLWTGYVDAYLGWWTMVAAFYLILYRQTNQSVYRWLGFGFALSLPLLKNEGTPLAFILILSWFLFCSIRDQRSSVFKDWRLAILCLSPLSWWIYKAVYSLQNDLAGQLDFGRVVARFWSADFWKIYWDMLITYSDLKYSVPLVLGGLFWSFWKKSQIPKYGVLFLCSCLFLYSAVLTFVYLSTHLSVEGHLHSSIARVSSALVYLSIALFIQLLQPTLRPETAAQTASKYG